MNNHLLQKIYITTFVVDFCIIRNINILSYSTALNMKRDQFHKNSLTPGTAFRVMEKEEIPYEKKEKKK